MISRTLARASMRRTPRRARPVPRHCSIARLPIRQGDVDDVQFVRITHGVGRCSRQCRYRPRNVPSRRCAQRRPTARRQQRRSRPGCRARHALHERRHRAPPPRATRTRSAPAAANDRAVAAPMFRLAPVISAVRPSSDKFTRFLDSRVALETNTAPRPPLRAARGGGTIGVAGRARLGQRQLGRAGRRRRSAGLVGRARALSR